MKKHLSFLFSLPIMVGLFASCSHGPQLATWQPWTRIFNGQEAIQPGSSVRVEAKGNAVPQVGEDALMKQEFEDVLGSMLERRGFTMTKNQADYRVVLNYKTEQHQSFSSSSSASSSSASSASTASAAGASPLGNLLVALAGKTGSKSESSIENVTQSVERYTHSIAVEFLDKNGLSMWKGVSSWNSQNFDLLDEYHRPLRLIVTNLPTTNNVAPRVAEVKRGKEKLYFTQNASGWLACPALMTAITFKSVGWGDSIPDAVKNPRAIVAFVDLLRTTESALPVGDDDYTDPTIKDLWDEVLLGGKYLIGNDQIETKILVKIETGLNGYIVKKCWIASESEYADYVRKLLYWNSCVDKYYDIYVK